MKKLLAILMGVVFALSGCQQAMLPLQPLTLESMINSGKEEIDLEKITCNEDVTITQAVKIKNGDFNGKTLTVNVSGVVLENAKNVNIVVGAAVGDGDFTVKASEVATFKVLGGGANSIHVNDTKVSEICVAKDNVRVSFEGKTNITKLQVKKGITAKVEVNSSEVKIDAAEVVAEDGSKVEGESVALKVAEGVDFKAPEGAKTGENKPVEEKKDTPAAGKSEITEFTLSFDDTKISVTKDGPVVLKNGDKVHKGDSFVIVVEKVETGKVFDKFVISGKEYNAEASVVYYYLIESLDSTYANGSVIEISYTTKDLIAYTVTFEGEDGGTISRCEIVGGNDITNGETVYEGEMLEFTATPSEGKVVDKWYVNGTEQSDYASEKYCYVTLRPSEITGTEVNVTCSFQDAVEYTVTFGEGISCRDISNRADIKTINLGLKVYEGHVLEFSVSPEAGQIVKNWSLNGKPQSDSEDQKLFNVELRRSEITENTVDVTVTYK